MSEKNVNKPIKTLEEAIDEASRCLRCAKPMCKVGCPAHNNIPEFLKKITEIDIQGAYNAIKERNNMPEITSRVCYSQFQCENKCALAKTGNPIKIKELERFVADFITEKKQAIEEDSTISLIGQTVGIIGSGPCALSCAMLLAENGYSVTIYEKEEKAGGVLEYGIPDFRLSTETVDIVIQKLKKLKIEFVFNANVGVNINLFDIRNTHDFVVLATGTNVPKLINILGESEILHNKENKKNNYLVYSSNFLKMAKEKRSFNFEGPVVVIGGGDVAMDCARVARKFTRDVTVIYRRTEDKMPARLDEIENAKQEGIKFEFLTSIDSLKLNEKNMVTLALHKNVIVKGEGKINIIKPMPNSNYESEYAHVIIAIGLETDHESYTKDVLGLTTNDDGTIIVNDQYLVNTDDNLYAGGDLVTGSKTVIDAIKGGMQIAKNIIKDNTKME